ncbi:DUF6257 family protein [Streptomyces sp. NPDC001941]|uniref:DUF6257 family protein n=1 Tax=Streptomyces sp. NPDC001941 TaxID=3154659 RepID=UPI0033229317
MSSSEPRLTVGEKTRVALYVARMAKRSLADGHTGRVYQEDLQRRVDRVIDKAREREERGGGRK